MDERFGEGKLLVAIIYNTTLVCILIPAFCFIVWELPEPLFLLQCFGIFYLCISNMFVLFLPKIIHVTRDWFYQHTDFQRHINLLRTSDAAKRRAILAPAPAPATPQSQTQLQFLAITPLVRPLQLLYAVIHPLLLLFQRIKHHLPILIIHRQLRLSLFPKMRSILRLLHPV